jgi:hypothetical protein
VSAFADAAAEEALTTWRLILSFLADSFRNTRITVFAFLVNDALVEEDLAANEDRECVVAIKPPPPLEEEEAKTRCTSVNFPPSRKRRCDNIFLLLLPRAYAERVPSLPVFYPSSSLYP